MKSIVDSFLDGIEMRNEPREGEYLGENGPPVLREVPYTNSVQETGLRENADTSLYLQMPSGGNAEEKGGR